MTNGNRTIIAKLQEVIEKDGNIDPKMRDVLLFEAIIDLYGQLEKLQPVLTFYRVGMFFASAIGLAIISFIGAMLTGKVAVVFK